MRGVRRLRIVACIRVRLLRRFLRRFLRRVVVCRNRLGEVGLRHLLVVLVRHKR